MDRLKEGDVIDITSEHLVLADVPARMVYQRTAQPDKLVHTVVAVKDFPHMAGRYVVHKTTTDGGGTGHGPHDIYPNGHHVHCEKIDDPNVRLDFYQSGCFTAMIKDIKPVGFATRSWVVLA